MRFRSTAVVLMLAACSACDLLEPEREIPVSRPDGPRLVMLNDSQFAADFGTYAHDQSLRAADWTAISRYSTGTTPYLGDWRARDITGGLNDRAAVLVNPSLESLAGAALRWDSLPVLSPPLEILTHVWFPPVENHPRVGLGWFIQEPDSTGQFIGYAIIRNYTSPPKNGFDIYRMVTIGGGVWFGPGDDGMEAGGWAWIRMRHTIGESSGTIQYRAWAGALEDEPETWDFDETSTWFGPDGGRHGPNISGGVGLFAMGHENMAGATLMWDAFTIGINGAPAPPPPLADTADFSVSVSCPASVVRGVNASCTATLNPAGATVVGWEFEPAPVVIHPKVGPVQTADPISLVSPSSTWSGTMVVPGRVRVQAEFQGDSLWAEADIAVQNRDWVTDKVWHGAVDPGYGIAPMIGDTVRYGENVHVDSTGFKSGVVLDGYNPGASGSSAFDTTHIRTVSDSGPNHTYQFVEQFPIRLSRGYRVNRYLTPENTDRDIRIRGTWYNRWDALIQENWGNPDDALQGTILHESYGIGGQTGHQDGFEQAVTGDRCGNVALRLERIAGSPAVVDQTLQELRGHVFVFLHAASHHYRVYGHHGTGSPVVVRTTTNPRPLQFTLNDEQDSLPFIPATHRQVCEIEELGL